MQFQHPAEDDQRRRQSYGDSADRDRSSPDSRGEPNQQDLHDSDRYGERGAGQDSAEQTRFAEGRFPDQYREAYQGSHPQRDPRVGQGGGYGAHQPRQQYGPQGHPAQSPFGQPDPSLSQGYFEERRQGRGSPAYGQPYYQQGGGDSGNPPGDWGYPRPPGRGPGGNPNAPGYLGGYPEQELEHGGPHSGPRPYGRPEDRGFPRVPGEQPYGDRSRTDPAGTIFAAAGSRSRSAPHRRKGPRNYTRSDERIAEEVNERLMHAESLDPSDIEVSVDKGEVTLVGSVSDRHDKFEAEWIADSVMGVKDITNRIRVRRHETEAHDQRSLGQERSRTVEEADRKADSGGNGAEPRH